MRVYANNDAYTASKWQIWSDQTPDYTMAPVYLKVDSGYSQNQTTAENDAITPQYIYNHDTDGGYTRITALSSGSITI